MYISECITPREAIKFVDLQWTTIRCIRFILYCIEHIADTIDYFEQCLWKDAKPEPIIYSMYEHADYISTEPLYLRSNYAQFLIRWTPRTKFLDFFAS